MSLDACWEQLFTGGVHGLPWVSGCSDEGENIGASWWVVELYGLVAVLLFGSTLSFGDPSEVYCAVLGCA